MNESFEEVTKVEPAHITKTSGFVVVSAFVMMAVYLFVFYSMINIVGGTFEKIVICILTLIFFQNQGRGVVDELKEHGKNISAGKGALLLIFNSIPSITVSVSLIYFIFLTHG